MGKEFRSRLVVCYSVEDLMLVDSSFSNVIVIEMESKLQILPTIDMNSSANCQIQVDDDDLLSIYSTSADFDSNDSPSTRFGMSSSSSSSFPSPIFFSIFL